MTKRPKDDKCFFKLSDNLAFRSCKKTGHCTNKRIPTEREIELQTKAWEENIGYMPVNVVESGECCLQGEVHWHCAKHREIELHESRRRFFCIECEKEAKENKITYDGITFNKELEFQKAKSILNSVDFNDYELIDLDDVYVRVSKRDKHTEDEYFIETTVKESSKGEKLIMILIGNKDGTGEKAQLFFRPKTGQLTFDYRDKPLSDFFTDILATFGDSILYKKLLMENIKNE